MPGIALPHPWAHAASAFVIGSLASLSRGKAKLHGAAGKSNDTVQWPILRKSPLWSPALTNRPALLSAVVGAVIVSLASGAGAEPSAPNPQASATREWTASVRWENDVFGGTDRFYTNGVSVAVTHTGRSWMDPVADWLPWGRGRRTVGYDVGQGMVTPADKTRPVPDPNDRPYVGFLGVGLSLHVDRSNAYHGLRFVTGVVGPSSLAEETQRGVHRLVGIDEPQGWDYQFTNEPVLNLTYEYRHKFRLAGRRDRWSVEALPTTGVATPGGRR